MSHHEHPEEQEREELVYHLHALLFLSGETNLE